MAEDTDFAALYRELGIDASCTLAELRNAYRRRVAKLHPDQGGSAEDTGRLQRLNRLHTAAIDFHRRYGRLPGSPSSGRAAESGAAAAAAQTAVRPDRPPGIGASAEAQASAIPTRPAGFGKITRYFVAVSLVGMFALAWRVAGLGPVVAEQATATGMEPAQRTPHATAIVPGMGKRAVLELQGEPLEMEALRWNYGPSWVEFRCDKVVDWYSSPLQPLSVGSERGAVAGTVAPHDAPCE